MGVNCFHRDFSGLWWSGGLYVNMNGFTVTGDLGFRF